MGRSSSGSVGRPAQASSVRHASRRREGPLASPRLAPRGRAALTDLPAELFVDIYAYLPAPDVNATRLSDVGALRQAWPPRAACGLVAHPELGDRVTSRLAQDYLLGSSNLLPQGLMDQLARCRALNLAGLGLVDSRPVAYRLGQLLRHAPQLHKLNLEHNALGLHAARALPLHLLPNLVALHLNWNRLGPAGVAALQVQLLPNLQVLELAGNGLGLRGARSLQLAVGCPLVTLDVRENHLGHLGLQALQLPAFPTLRHLKVGCNALGPRGAAFVATSLAPQLHILEMGYNQLGAPGLHNLLRGNFAHLRELYVADNAVGVAHTAVPSFAGLVALEVLDISKNNLGVAPLQGANLQACGKLTELYCEYNALGAHGLHALRIDLLTGLRCLDLAGNVLALDRLLFLRLAPLDRLVGLSLADNALGDAVLAGFEGTHFARMQRLDLRHNVFSRPARLARGIRQMCELVGVYLEHNLLNVQAMLALAAAAPQTLRMLRLTNNAQPPPLLALRMAAPHTSFV